MALRFPILYPMPRDEGQYRAIIEVALSEPSDPPEAEKSEFIQKIREVVLKEDGTEYGKEMYKGIRSNIIRCGFVEKSDDGVIRPSQTSKKWIGKRITFRQCVQQCLRNSWRVNFNDGIVLLSDILQFLDKQGTAVMPHRIRDALSLGATGKGGKYDIDKKSPTTSRSLQEFLKLMQLAGWIESEGKRYRITPQGVADKSKITSWDIFQTAMKIIRNNGTNTDLLSSSDKIAITKYYMYRQSGGIGKRNLFKKIAKLIYKNPDSPSLHLKDAFKEGKDKLKAKRAKIIEDILSTEIGKEFIKGDFRLYKIEKLSRLRKAALNGDFKGFHDLRDPKSFLFSRRSSSFELKEIKTHGSPFSLDTSISLYDWQDKAVLEWVRNGKKGILSVVTGAGKTIMAFKAIDLYFKENPKARVSIIVPTKILMYQWAKELVRLMAIPVEKIGLRGDGYKDSFKEGKTVMVTIVNSAIKDSYLKKDIEYLDSSNSHLIIADECHRYRGEKFSKVFETRYNHTLGLSATPLERTNTFGTDGKEKTEKSLIEEKLGDIFFTYTYKQARADEIIPPFEIIYAGVDLGPREKLIYDSYTKKIGKAIDKIRLRYGPRIDSISGKSLDEKLNIILKTDEYPDRAIYDYFKFTRERKDIVYDAKNRSKCYLDIINFYNARDKDVEHPLYKLHYKNEADASKEHKIIVFQERIQQLADTIAPLERRTIQGKAGKYKDDPDLHEVDKRLEDLFNSANFRSVMYHTGHENPYWNYVAMEWFRDGTANVMLSVKALIEGVDVPKADVGIIRVSTSSVRQRIQTAGRILRSVEGKDKSFLFVIYVKGTTDERIFREYDWETELGTSEISSWHWTFDNESPTRGMWEKEARLPEYFEYEEKLPPLEVDISKLKIGEGYPGRYAGREYHVDAKGHPFTRSKYGRRFITNPEFIKAAELVYSLKGGGKFVMTPYGHLVTKIKGKPLVYLGFADIHNFKIKYSNQKLKSSKDAEKKGKSRPLTFDELISQIP